MRPVPLLVVAALTALVVFAGMLATRQPPPQAAVSPTPLVSPASSATPTPTASPTTAPTATPSPTAAGTFEDRVLGYRITLPSGYRRSVARLTPGSGDILGITEFTVETEQQSRERCQRDAGHLPVVLDPPNIGVTVYQDTKSASAQEWTTTSPRSTHHKVEPADVPGYDAARLVQDNANAGTTAVIVRVVRGVTRVYEIAWSGAYGDGHRRLLDGIARTFAAIPPDPFPSPTATVAPRTAANETAQALARAFAARDADAVARHMPECWIAVVYAIDGVSPGQGPLNRSVSLFAQALRQRFAAGDLTVTVDPTLQSGREPDSYVIRSEWRRPEGARRVDLEIVHRDGRGLWLIARHHFTRGEASCIWYGSPWTDDPARC